MKNQQLLDQSKNCSSSHNSNSQDSISKLKNSLNLISSSTSGSDILTKTLQASGVAAQNLNFLTQNNKLPAQVLSGPLSNQLSNQLSNHLSNQISNQISNQLSSQILTNISRQQISPLGAPSVSLQQIAHAQLMASNISQNIGFLHGGNLGERKSRRPRTAFTENE